MRIKTQSEGEAGPQFENMVLLPFPLQVIQAKKKKKCCKKFKKGKRCKKCPANCR